MSLSRAKATWKRNVLPPPLPDVVSLAAGVDVGVDAVSRVAHADAVDGVVLDAAAAGGLFMFTALDTSRQRNTSQTRYNASAERQSVNTERNH